MENMPLKQKPKVAVQVTFTNPITKMETSNRLAQKSRNNTTVNMYALKIM